MSRPSIEDKKAKRLEEWRIWLKEFQDKTNAPNPAPEYVTIEHAAELLNDFYWRLYKLSLKGLLSFTDGGHEHNLHYYKIISASEMAVMAVLPFDFEDTKANNTEDRRKINAEFAFFVAITLFSNWELTKSIVKPQAQIDVSTFKEPIDKNGDEDVLYPVNFVNEHIQWLMQLNVAAIPLPVLLNSQLWRMFFFAVKFKSESSQ